MLLREYIQKFRGKKFEWGKYDCYQFVVGRLDELYPDGRNKRPAFEYKDELDVIEISKEYKWLDEISKIYEYEIIEFENIKDDDLLIIKTPNCECAHLVWQGKAYSMHIGHTLLGVNVSFFQNMNPLIIKVKGVRK